MRHEGAPIHEGSVENASAKDWADAPCANTRFNAANTSWLWKCVIPTSASQGGPALANKMRLGLTCFNMGMVSAQNAFGSPSA